jgi:hypothetical protein
VSGFVSRYEVKKEIEKALDASQPREKRMEKWGVEMTRSQWIQLKAQSQKRKKPATATEAFGLDRK